MRWLQGPASVAAEACRCVEILSYQDAVSLLRLAQSNSSNWSSNRHGHMVPLPNRAHLFVRIMLYNSCKQQISTLHVVDLAGSQNVAAKQPDDQQHQEKLLINRQLLGLSRLVSELSHVSASQGQL